MEKIINMVSLIITALSLLVSIYFYIKSRSFKQPTFIHAYNALQSKVHPQITILFKGNNINNLTRSLILFYNSGTKEIRKEDIPNNVYPTITFPNEIKILSQSIIGSSNPNINISSNLVNDKTITIKFDYLNTNDGAVIEIMLEDNFGTNKFPGKCEAIFIGSNPPVVKKLTEKPPIVNRQLKVMLPLVLILSAIQLSINYLNDYITVALIIILGSLFYAKKIYLPISTQLPMFARECLYGDD